MSKREELIKDLPLATQEAIKRYPRFPERRVGFIDGYQYAVEKACEFLKEKEFGDWIEQEASSFIEDFRKAMEE
jgi:hypothetical protein